MDTADRPFTDSIFDFPAHLYNPRLNFRRHSAASTASNLKDLSLIRASPAVNRRLSLTAPVPRFDLHLTAAATDSQVPKPPYTGPLTRSARKAKPVPAPKVMADKTKPSTSSSQDTMLSKMEGWIFGLKEDIARTEASTIAKIDTMVDSLLTKLSTRLDAAEGEIAKVGKQLASED